jgi:hypothetical protein
MLVEEGPRGFSAASTKERHERHERTARVLLDRMRTLTVPR